VKEYLLFNNIISTIFNTFASQNIPFCVLRNYRELPYRNIGSDIDILVSIRGYSGAINILLNLLDKLDLILFHKVVTGRTKSNYKLVYTLDNNKHRLLPLDIHNCFNYYGAVYLTAERVLSKRIPMKNFYAPNAVHEAIICWLSPFLYGGSIKEKYKKFVINTAQKNKGEFLNELSYIVGKRLALQIYPTMIKGNWQGVERFRFSIRLSVLLHALLRKPVHSIRNFCKLLYTTFKYQLFPPGMFVVLLGPDGSGKTTIAENVFARLCKPLRLDDKCLLHWRPGMIPQLNRLFKKITLSNDKRKNDIRPTKSKPSGFILSLFKLTYYSLDYLLGYFFVVRLKLYRGKLVIFDRYYYNFMVDPYRSKVNLPSFIPEFIMNFIPKPDVIICFENEPVTILKRKQELSIEEIKRQINDYRNLTFRLPNGYIVNGDKSVNNVTDEVIDIILKRHAQKMN
jgi:thymidylate kinase